MKINLKNSLIVIFACVTTLVSCKRESDYVKSTPSNYISNLDLRSLYKGSDVTLTRSLTREATVVRGQVTSDHSGKNLPTGLMFLQNKRSSGNGVEIVRGMAFNLGSEAANYLPGDSVHVNIEGAVLTRVNGILQITGVTSAKIEKVATGVDLIETKVSSTSLIAKPDDYEGLFVQVFNVNFEPNIGVEKLEGNKVFDDGLGTIEMHVGASATFKNEFLPYSANVKGLILPSPADGKMQLWPRIKSDFFPTSIVVDPNIPLGLTPAIITGYMNDPLGSDAGFEYIQLMATQDLDFRQKNFSLITTNNAGNSTPTGFPEKGWATGGLRTYKINIDKGTVAKGSFFYVGGNKVITGGGSTSIEQANWVGNRLYNTVAGDDGIGDPTANLLANSGNVGGIAIFPTKNVSLLTKPSDVVFFGGNGSVYGVLNGVTVGYAITNTDIYKTMNGAANQPFYGQGTNTTKYAFPSANFFIYLGGTFNVGTNTWTKIRTSNGIKLLGSSELSLIENNPAFTIITN